MQWTLKGKQDILSTIPFTVESLDLYDNYRKIDLEHPFYRLKTHDWANVLAITPDNKAVLVRQQRAGTLSYTTEVPGGVIDAGEAPQVAASRELEEETGYTSPKLQKLSQINPNPAIMNNTLHMFVAWDATPSQNRKHFPDENESIEVQLIPLEHLDAMIQRQEIDSALAALTILLSKPFWPA